MNPNTLYFNALFVQSARSISYHNGLLTLYGLTPTTLMFSDQPPRIIGHIPTEDFFESWEVGENCFAIDPPNAVLSIFTEDEAIDVVVVLREPALDGDQWSYSVDILDGEIPSSGGPISLFIDVVGHPLTPISVADVQFQTNRTARRKVRSTRNHIQEFKSPGAERTIFKPRLNYSLSK